ncbi:MAG: OmpH family outer membrane protein [Muribaculaceae bacterium]|nr:OmpH family outer membrane protein [Muribaculaceae bacterium]
MKKTIITTLMLVAVPVMAMAQMKIATVDVQAVFNAMPDAKTAAAELENYSKQLNAEYEMMQAEFNRKYADYQLIAGDAKTPTTIKDRRVREIQDSDRDIDKFLTTSRESIAARKALLEQPIYDKINSAIKQVGDANGYTYIIDVSTTPVVYRGANAIDVTEKVKALVGAQ